MWNWLGPLADMAKLPLIIAVNHCSTRPYSLICCSQTPILIPGGFGPHSWKSTLFIRDIIFLLGFKPDDMDSVGKLITTGLRYK